REKPYCRRILSSSSGPRRHTATNSTSAARRARLGRCEATVHDPAPMTPRRSLATFAFSLLVTFLLHQHYRCAPAVSSPPQRCAPAVASPPQVVVPRAGRAVSL